MIRPLLPALILLTAGCAAPSANEPSLAHRPAEDIDPRVPVSGETPAGVADAALASQLSAEVSAAEAGVAEFNARADTTARLAASAGAEASESWIAAQQALSRLVEQQGVTTRAAANVDALAAKKLQVDHWIAPVDQAAIKQAQERIAAIAAEQNGVIDRLTGQLSR